jgi:hypothetical protein
MLHSVDREGLLVNRRDAVDAIRSLADKAKAAPSPPAGEWRPISSAPKQTAIWLLVEGQPYLGFSERDLMDERDVWHVKAGFRRKDEYRQNRGLADEIYGCNGVHVTPTHWQPLPRPSPIRPGPERAARGGVRWIIPTFSTMR